jgi:hypothetical protein
MERQRRAEPIALRAVRGGEPGPQGPAPLRSPLVQVHRAPAFGVGSPDRQEVAVGGERGPESIAQRSVLRAQHAGLGPAIAVAAEDVDRSRVARRDRKTDQRAGPAEEDLVAGDRGGAAEADESGRGGPERLGSAGGRKGEQGSGDTEGHETEAHGSNPGLGRAESLHRAPALGNMMEG